MSRDAMLPMPGCLPGVRLVDGAPDVRILGVSLGERLQNLILRTQVLLQDFHSVVVFRQLFLEKRLQTSAIRRDVIRERWHLTIKERI